MSQRKNREALVQLHKETEYQGEVIDSIGKDILEANTNMDEMMKEAYDQGRIIDNANTKVVDAKQTVKRTEKRITRMNRTEFCTKIMLHVLAFLLLVANIALIVYKVTK